MSARSVNGALGSTEEEIMRKITTMEVVSLEEAQQMGKLIDFEVTDNGFMCEIEVDEYVVPVSPECKAKPKKDYYIYSPTCAKYVTKKGYSYYAGDAEYFDERTAKTKAHFMSKQHGHTWEACKL